jgi:thioredoxin reductase (NADPH)
MELEKKDYDLVIVGAGPAALSAAIYTCREDIDTLLFEKGAIGGLASVTDWVDNYPGFADGIAGLQLSDAMQKQAERFGAKIELGEVLSLKKDNHLIKLDTTSGQINAKAVLIATGSEYRKIGVPGELDYYARGVHYCATCDGAFYRDKRLVVVGDVRSGSTLQIASATGEGATSALMIREYLEHHEKISQAAVATLYGD